MADLYVAGSWSDRDRVREVMLALICQGHTITYDWTQVEQSSTIQAQHDKRGVERADALVLVMEKEYIYRGAWVEMGIAVGLGIPVFVFGQANREWCLFFQLPGVYYVERLSDVGAYLGPRDVPGSDLAHFPSEATPRE